jgi:hypothetical protein
MPQPVRKSTGRSAKRRKRSLPPAVWLGYLVPELLVSLLMIAAQLVANRTLAARQGG